MDELKGKNNNKVMDEYVKRMLDEFEELDERVMKLGTFLNGDDYKALLLEEQRDLFDQWHAMVLYKSALGRRLVRRGYDDIFYAGDSPG